ncbi:hypothetical protein [Streptomyces sp. NPDC002889]|uniref:hypothetical protein n=1 Tax=Streptomyces sp. NPDC002889 TaxID=3364669 RepID=UPI0036B6FFFE
MPLREPGRRRTFSSGFGLLAQTRDLVVLGGQPGDRQRLERGEFGQLCITACDPFLQLGDLLLEPFDLGGPRVDDLTGLLESSEPSLELLGEVLVGAGRIRRGPSSDRTRSGSPGLGGQGLEVGLAARR